MTANLASQEKTKVDTLLRIEDLHVKLRADAGGVELLRGVSLDVRAGEIVGIVGESGSGKTMLAMSVLQLLPKDVEITAGEIYLQGENLAKADAARLREVRGKDVGVVFQDPMTALNPLHKVGKQVAEPLRLHGLAARKQRMTQAVETLRRVGIPESERRANNRPFEFSGGMRQRALIAEALSCEPRLLIADEPTTGLDVTIQVQILELLDRMRRENDMAIILISHDLTMVAGICDRIAVVYAGKVVEDGPTADVLLRPLHPYAQALARAMPTLATPPGASLPALPGMPPPMGKLGRGCSFAPRCAYVEEKCWREEPPSEEIVPGHRSACWVAQRDGGLGGDPR
jgi:oligopeptide/dipeptide ABC transporter ATP-binding protein